MMKMTLGAFFAINLFKRYNQNFHHHHLLYLSLTQSPPPKPPPQPSSTTTTITPSSSLFPLPIYAQNPSS